MREPVGGLLAEVGCMSVGVPKSVSSHGLSFQRITFYLLYNRNMWFNPASPLQCRHSGMMELAYIVPLPPIVRISPQLCV